MSGLQLVNSTFKLTASCSWKGCRQFSPRQMESYLVVSSSENFRELFSSFIMCKASTIPWPSESPPPVSESSRSLQECHTAVHTCINYYSRWSRQPLFQEVTASSIVYLLMSSTRGWTSPMRCDSEGSRCVASCCRTTCTTA